MKYYKYLGGVFAYDSDGSQDAYIPAEAVQMTGAEVQQHLAPPPPSLAAMVPVSIAQMRAALVLLDVISRAEAVAWAAGDLPDLIVSAIDKLPLQEAVVAEQRALSAQIVEPLSPVVAAIATEAEKDESFMIQLFTLAATL